jgi:hypothetical protein
MKHANRLFASALLLLATLTTTARIRYESVTDTTSITEKAHSWNEVPRDTSPWAHAVGNDWHVLFEGTPLGQPYGSFIDELVSSHGYELLWKTERQAVLRGTWKGFPGTKVVVHNRGGVCYMVEAYPKATLTIADALNQYAPLRDSLAAYSAIDPMTLEAYTVHRLEKGSPEAYEDKELSGDLDYGDDSWMTMYMLPEGHLKLEILGRNGIGNAYARYRKGRFQVHAIYRDNHSSDKVSHIDYLHPEKSWHN